MVARKWLMADIVSKISVDIRALDQHVCHTRQSMAPDWACLEVGTAVWWLSAAPEQDAACSSASQFYSNMGQY